MFFDAPEMEPCSDLFWRHTECDRPADVDMVAINLDVNLDIIQILKLLVGNTVAIGTATHRRFHHEPDYDAVVLAYNPISDYITNGRP